MNSDKLKTTQHEYLNKIRFKPVSIDRDKLYQKISSRISDKYPMGNTISLRWKYLAIASSVALLILCSYLFLINEKKEDISSVIACMEISSLEGSKTRLILPDGSIVWLNGSSTLRYPQIFDSQERCVSLEGEAMFEVAKNEEAPFRVKVNGLEIEVLGTVFNVYAGTESPFVETTLLKGSIGLFPEVNTSCVVSHILQPNQRAIYNKENGDMQITTVRGELYSSWVTGDFNFEKNTMREIIFVLQRAFNNPIHIERETINDVRLTARFLHKESLEEILSILSKPGRFKYRREKGEFFIY